MTWTGSISDLLAASPAAVALQTQCEPGRRTSLASGIAVLQDALRQAQPLHGHVVAGLRLLRLGRRIDAVLVLGGAVLVLHIRVDARAFLSTDRTAAEDAALDLVGLPSGLPRLARHPAADRAQWGLRPGRTPLAAGRRNPGGRGDAPVAARRAARPGRPVPAKAP